MRVSAGYWANTKPTRIQVGVSIYNTKPAATLKIIRNGRICGFAGTIAIPNSSYG